MVLETTIMKLEDIRLAAYNPRVTLKPGDTEYEALKNSLDRFGVAEPLIVNRTTGNLISGHQRLNILKVSGVQEVEAVIVEMNEEQEKLLNIAMNKIDGEWDYKKLEDLFDEISEDDIKFTGFTTEELDNLFDGGIPDWEDEEEIVGESGSGEDGDGRLETEEKQQALKEFSIFLSFPSKELAEKWITDRGVDLTYEGTARNITIRMEGLGYGTGN